MTAYTFSQLIDFTRTSAATFVNSSGNIASTPQSRNLLTFTQEFDNAAWTKGDTSVSANTAVAPDGTSTADTLAETATTASHSVLQTVSSVSAAQHVFSVYLKKGTGATAPDWVQLTFGGASTNYANFNLATGGVGVVSGVTANIASVGSGWYRCSVIVAIPTAGALSVHVAFTNNTDSATRRPSYAGATTSDVFAWGAQLEQASSATDYTRNFGGLFPPRFDYDPVTRAPRGLLIEEQRTNLLTGSDDFTATYWPTATNVVVTANNTTSPDGTSNADLLEDNTAASAEHRLFRSYTFTAAAHTLSLYVKRNTHRWFRLFFFDGTTSFYANFDLLNGVTGNKHASATSTITAVGNSWFRITMTATTAAAAGNVQLAMLDSDSIIVPAPYTGTGTSLWLYGAQLEAGAFATSYIPTVASQVTRSADQAAINAPNFASWYNGTAGTIVVEADYVGVSATSAQSTAVSLSDGTTNNRMRISSGSTTTPTFEGAVSGASQWSLSGTIVAGAVFKFAGAYSANDIAASLNGQAALTDTSASIPTVNQMGIGGFLTGRELNGHIRSIKYFPTRLSNAQLQALTA